MLGKPRFRPSRAHPQGLALLPPHNLCSPPPLLPLLLTQDREHAIALEEEISAFGTGLSREAQSSADAVYDNTWNDDPGHISRAEVRFNRALHAAGGLSQAHTSKAPAYDEKKAPAGIKQNLKQWTAYPDPGADGGGTVNIIINKKHASRGRAQGGMSSLAARQDLESYFDGLGSQIHTLERKHVSEVLRRLDTDDAQPSEGQEGGRSSPGRRTRSSGSTAKMPKDSSMLRLLEKAMKSNDFRHEIRQLKAELHVGWHT